MNYQATVSYPRNPKQDWEIAEAATISEAVDMAMAESANNVSRIVEVIDLRDCRTVKGPYVQPPDYVRRLPRRAR